MIGILINIAIPSVEDIEKKDKESVKSLLQSALKINRDLAVYLQALNDRLREDL